MPYLAYVKRISKSLPHLEYLAHWMEVTCAPPKWKFIKKHIPNREQRAQRCRVCVLDFVDETFTTQATHEDVKRLATTLQETPQCAGRAHDRLVIVEDLSRDVVELLGAQFDIDPLFFLSHIGDYLFHNTRDRWVELPDLDVIARQRPHFNLQYLRARYFKTPESFSKAECESGTFNVLRRLDSDRSRQRLQNTLLDMEGASVTLTRAKTSLWVKPRKSNDEPLLGKLCICAWFQCNTDEAAILFVDPTVTEGFPLWGGYRPFENTPSMHAKEAVEAPKRNSLFEDAVYWCARMTKHDIALAREDPKCIALPMYRLVLADWRTVQKYMSTMLGKIEWEFENPHWGEKPSDIDGSLRKLSPWRRNMSYYQGMIADAIHRLFPPELRTPVRGEYATSNSITGMTSLLHDFRIVQQQMDASQQRIEGIQTMATNSINIEESRRAVQQNKNLARLTFLATIFIPMSFTSSFLSMSPDFLSATETIWIFFAIGIPLTAFALIVVDLSHPQEGIIARKWRAISTRKKHQSDSSSRSSEAFPKAERRRKTIPWSTSSSGLTSR